MSKKKRGGRVRRKVTVSVVAPVSATVVVERADDDSWEIVELLEINAHASLSTVRENMGDDEFADLERKAAAAEDLR